MSLLLINMEHQIMRSGCLRAIGACHRRAFHTTRRQLATVSEPNGPITAAAPHDFSDDPNQFVRKTEIIETGLRNSTRGGFRNDRRRGGFSSERRVGRGGDQLDPRDDPILRRIRIVPASPSYFTATPRYTDDLLHLSALLRKHTTLPILPAIEAPKVAWKTIDLYKAEVSEPVRVKGYSMLVQLLKRLNRIHPSLIPEEVTQALEKFKRRVQPHHNVPKPIIIDKWGRAKAVGRRKSSSASVFVVEGEGNVMINGRTLTNYFGRLHDRETAVWGLKVTQRMDKYNVWALAKGGGTTGQADAIALGLAKALLAHEPDLKPALRKGETMLCQFNRVVLKFYSWCLDTRPQTRRKKKAGKAQGSQDARLGQTLALPLLYHTVHIFGGQNGQQAIIRPYNILSHFSSQPEDWSGVAGALLFCSLTSQRFEHSSRQHKATHSKGLEGDVQFGHQQNSSHIADGLACAAGRSLTSRRSFTAFFAMLVIVERLPVRTRMTESLHMLPTSHHTITSLFLHNTPLLTGRQCCCVC